MAQYGVQDQVFDAPFARDVIRRAAAAVADVTDEAEPVTHLGLGRAVVERRLPIAASSALPSGLPSLAMAIHDRGLPSNPRPTRLGHCDSLRSGFSGDDVTSLSSSKQGSPILRLTRFTCSTSRAYT